MRRTRAVRWGEKGGPKVARHNGKRFDGETLDVDGEEYYTCVFINCTWNYGGGPTPVIVHCRMHNLHWHFHDSAVHTINTLANLYALGGKSRQIVEEVLDSIRGLVEEGGDAPPVH